MIVKLVFLVLLYLMLYSTSSTIVLLSYLFGQNKEIMNIVKRNLSDLFNITYQIGFNSPIYYTGNYIKTDNVDIIIANHINTIDFVLNNVIVNYFDKKNFNFIISKKVTYLPGLGFLLSSSTDIKLNRKLLEDKDNIVNSIKKIRNGIIILFPEGTRFTPEKHKLAKEYSTKNKLPVFKNTLYPKMKGIHLIINILRENNRLGNLIDLTHYVENNKTYMKDMLKEEMGNTYSVINTYNIPKDNSLEDYDYFKSWFLQIWQKKDNYIDNIKNYNYQKLPVKLSPIYLTSVFLIVIFYVFINVKTKGKYFIGTLILSYIITLIRNLR
uniref:Phospholipid/glycerol acyltransferase domain-containing protein n=1 Tax=viral metagenome TaxID=1070528 RepID=A0A6C0J6E4_9ZZZZ